MDFEVENFVETRSDNPNLAGCKVHLDGFIYFLYYDKETLREVYLMGRYPKYYMSCRADMTTVSHYYIEGDKIKRYENGVLNQIYTMYSPIITLCEKNGEEVIYKVQRGTYLFTPQKLYDDLIKFLQDFNEKEMYNLFIPQESKQNARVVSSG